jgi:predicted permease
MADAMRRELRSAVRRLLRTPGFTATAVATLGAGLAATAALFTVVQGVVLEPLPYPHADRIVHVFHLMDTGGAGPTEWPTTRHGFLAFRDRNRVFEAVGGYRTQPQPLVGDGVAEELTTARVTAGVWDVLGARAEVGRLFGPAEDRPGADAVVVLGHRVWQTRYGGDPHVVGRVVELGGVRREVVGVTGPDVHLPRQEVDAWIPEAIDPAARPTDQFRIDILARRAPGWSDEAVQDDLERVQALLGEAIPFFPSIEEQFGLRTTFRSLREEVLGQVERALWILLGAVGIVLVVAGANVANLFLVRAEGRRFEVGIRRALGASRRDALVHFLADSLVVTLAAWALGLALAAGAVRLLVRLAPPSIPRIEGLAVGGPTVGVTLLLSLGLAAALALWPWIRFAAVEAPAARARSGADPGPRSSRIRGLLTAGQVALAVVLLSGSALLLRSFQALRAVDPGYEPDGVFVGDVTLPPGRYPSDDEVVAVYRSLLSRLEALPGVERAAIGPSPVGLTEACSVGLVEGREVADEELPPCVPMTWGVSAGYFETLGMRLVSGRAFRPEDADARAPALVVTRNLAERLWPGEDPLGKGFRPVSPPRDHFLRVVGVVEPVRGQGLDRPASEMMYFPLTQPPGDGFENFAPRSATVLVRTEAGREREVTAPFRAAVAELEPNAPLAVRGSLRDAVDATMVRTSFTLLLMGAAAGITLLLGLVGVYGVVAYQVRGRSRELGLRIALGAEAGQVRNLVLGRSLRVVLAGLLVGLVAAVYLGRFLEALLFQVEPADPALLGLAAAAMASTALLASWIPARRATRIDPARTLREE